MTDFYTVLGVSIKATKEEIIAAFKRLSKIYHPDVKDTGNEERFKIILAAKKVLTDPANRASYDATLKQARDVQQKHNSRTINPEEQSATVVCKLEDILDINKTVIIDGHEFRMPGFYTPLLVYRSGIGFYSISFEINDITFGDFRFIPNYDGMCVTIKQTDVEYTENKMVTVDTPLGRITCYPDNVDKDEKVLTFLEKGIPFEQPITGRILHSSLLVGYK